MVDRLLVPIDGSALAECVLPHVMTFAQTFAAEVTLLHVMEPRYESGSIETIDPLHWQISKGEANAYLARLLAGLQSKGLAAQSKLLEGRAAERILDFALNDRSDLIALSSHGYSGLSDWSVGSVTQKLLARARGSKLVVRAHAHAEYTALDQITASRYHRIFVPLDGSWRAECVLPLVIKLAQFCDAEIVVAHVIRKPEMARRTPLADEDIQLATRVEERNRLETADYFEQLRARVGALATTHILSGESVAATLHESVGRSAADLVILSAHGFTGEMRWPYGSVAQSFIWGSPIPVFIFDDSSPCPPMQIEDTTTALRQHEVPAHA